MTRLLEASYAAGRWFAAEDEGRPLLDACTGEGSSGPRHRASTSVRDARYARDRRQAGAARADLPRARRAAQGARQAPDGRKDGVLRALARAPAPPRATHGSTSTAASARCSPTPARAGASCRTPPSTSTARVEPLAKGGTFVGQHICTPLAGRRRADQRLQLPGLGHAREARAGVPRRRADASSSRRRRPRTSPSSWSRRIVESGLLPEGALQLICGGAGDLFDHLDRPGHRRLHRLGRTPPAAAHPRQRARRAASRFNAEADSLNCSILGPDAAAGRPGVRPVRQASVVRRDDGQGRAEVHRDPPRVRARRRCSTPSSRRSRARLAKIVGRRPARPTASAWARWPASTSARRCRGRSQLAARARPRSSPATPTRVDRRSTATAERGAFLAAAAAARRRPDRGRAARRRGVRAGRTVIGLRHRRRGHRARRARQGQPGRRRWSPHDPAVARDVVLGRRARPRPGAGPRPRRRRASRPATARRCRPSCTAAPAAPAAARSSAASAASCTTCSAPRSRARPTCSPRSPAAGSRVAARDADGVHPFRKSLAELRIGDTLVAGAARGHARRHRATSPSSPATRSTRTWTRRPPQRTRSSAGSSRTATWSSRWPPGCSSTPTRARCSPTTASTTCASSRRSSPATRIAVTLTAKQITPRANADYGEVRWDAVVTNAEGEPVATYDVLTLVAKEWPSTS